MTEKIDGALEEFYTAKLAQRNGQKKWVQHWYSEVDRLLNMELRRVLRRPIKGKWDRRKAIVEVIDELRSVDSSYRKSVETDVKQYYGLKKITRPLPAEVTDQFYQMVQEVVDRTFRLQEPPEETGE